MTQQKQQLTNNERQNLVDLVTIESYTIKKASEMMKINYNTAKNIVQVWKSENRTNKLCKNKKKCTKNVDDLREIIELAISENCQTTLKNIKQKILERK
ncbi:hypothetical protein BDAP_002077, partial [Binucleata daphniae]